jgi:predicted NUDIX family phosphoesterase
MNNKIKETEEFVMVVPTTILWKAGYFQGFNSNVNLFLELLKNPENFQFKKRNEIESDPSFKQIIPYIVITYNNTILSYQRGKLQSEKRLMGSYSIGFGGHISVMDVNLFEVTYKEAMLRELYEEVIIESKYSEKIFGFINDDSNEVGKVHFGIIHIIELDNKNVKPKEKSINKLKFVTIQNLIEHYTYYENWSKICIDNIKHLI